MGGVLRLGILASYLVTVFLGGGLLAPWVWKGVQYLARGEAPGWVESLAGHPFHRYVHRCLLGLAVLGLWPLVRALGCRSWRDLGLRVDGRPRDALRQAWVGLVVAAAMFVATLIVELGFGLRQWKESLEAGSVLRAAVGAVVSGIVVAGLEEVLFRGVLCGGLRRSLGWEGAILASSGLYAMVHLFGRPPSPPTVDGWSGLGMVGGMLAGIGRTEAWVPGGLTLGVAGVWLAEWYRRTGALHGAIGLHAGWVIAAKLRLVLTAREPGAGGGIREGWIPFVLMVSVVSVAWLRGRTARRGGEPGNTLRVSGTG
jgi:membrane protease YdiL (CAAX protease family)